MNQKNRFKNMDKTRHYFLKEKWFDEAKHKKVSTVLNYIENVLILASVITWCIWVSSFDSLIGIFIAITSSAAGSKICLITTGIKKAKEAW